MSRRLRTAMILGAASVLAIFGAAGIGRLAPVPRWRRRAPRSRRSLPGATTPPASSATARPRTPIPRSPSPCPPASSPMRSPAAAVAATAERRLVRRLCHRFGQQALRVGRQLQRGAWRRLHHADLERHARRGGPAERCDARGHQRRTGSGVRDRFGRQPVRVGRRRLRQAGRRRHDQHRHTVVVSAPAGVTATAVAAGYESAYAIGSDGNLYAWGDNVYGELGDGNTNDSDTPVVVSLPAGVKPVTIAGGGGVGYAIGSDGNLYSWGLNADEPATAPNGTHGQQRHARSWCRCRRASRPKPSPAAAPSRTSSARTGTSTAGVSGASGQLGVTDSGMATTPVLVTLAPGVTPTRHFGQPAHRLRHRVRRERLRLGLRPER